MTQETMRLALFTGQDIGWELAKYFNERRDLDVRVYSFLSRNDRLHGYRSALDFCQEAGLPFCNCSSITPEVVADVRSFAPDLLVSAYYARLLPRELLEVPRLGSVNVHPGELPKYRGGFPTAWAIVQGEEEIGITLHMLDEGVDTGPILAQEKHPIGENETGFELYKRSMALCARLLTSKFADIASGRLKPQPQNPGGSYFGRFPARHEISWKAPRREIRNQVRAHAQPYFPAYSYLATKCALISEVSLVEISNYSPQNTGVILSVEQDGRFVVSCADGCLRVEDFQIVPIVSHEDIGPFITPGNRFNEI